MQIDEDLKDKVFERVMEYIIKHEAFCGESIHQSDKPILDAPNVMSDIVDNILNIEEIEYDDI
jgi:hypothetical protein